MSLCQCIIDKCSVNSKWCNLCETNYYFIFNFSIFIVNLVIITFFPFWNLNLFLIFVVLLMFSLRCNHCVHWTLLFYVLSSAKNILLWFFRILTHQRTQHSWRDHCVALNGSMFKKRVACPINKSTLLKHYPSNND